MQLLHLVIRALSPVLSGGFLVLAVPFPLASVLHDDSAVL